MDIWWSTPISLISSFQNRLINRLSLSEMILSGSPNLLNQVSKKSFAVWTAVELKVVGASMTYPVSASVIPRTESLPRVVGSGSTQSRVTTEHLVGGTGID